MPMKPYKQLFFTILLLFTRISAFAQLPELIPYRKGDLWGYSDSTGKIIIPCKYTAVSLFRKGGSGEVFLDKERKITFVVRTGKWGINELSGKEIVPCSFPYPANISLKEVNYQTNLLIDQKLMKIIVRNNKTEGFVNIENGVLY